MADFEHNKANLGAATLSSAITSSQTSITVDASDASTFPSTPFYATISPIGETPNLLNAEIVKVTAISSGTLTVTRGQRSTTAKAFAAGSVIFNGVYAQDLDYAQAVGRAFFTASYSAGVFYRVCCKHNYPHKTNFGHFHHLQHRKINASCFFSFFILAAPSAASFWRMASRSSASLRLSS